MKNRLQQESHGNLCSILSLVIEQPNLKRLEVTSCPSWVLVVYGDVHIRSYIHEVAWSWIIQQHGIDLMIIWRFDFATMIHQSGSSGLVTSWWNLPRFTILRGFPPAYHNSPLKNHPFMELLSWLKFWNKPCAEECWKISFFYLHILADSCT